MAHPEIGRLLDLCDELADVAVAETTPRQEGNDAHDPVEEPAGGGRGPARQAVKNG